MSATDLVGGALAPDAGALARIAQLEQLMAQTVQSFDAPSANANAAATLTSSDASATSAQNFATLLSAATSNQEGAAATGGAAVDTPTGYAAYSSLITQAAAQYGIDPSLLYGVISQESGFNPDAVSSAGAEGIAQIMPENFASLGVTDPFDAAQSINAGAKLLSENLATFDGNTTDAIAAYNAGAAAVTQYGGVPPYAQTENYVQRVLAYAAQYPGTQQPATSSSGADAGGSASLLAALLGSPTTLQPSGALA